MVDPYDSNQIGEVYVMKCEAYVKIGWSMTAQRRLNQISSCNPHEVTLLGSAPGTQGDERFIQMMLWKPYRVKGEWFRYEGLVVEVVENLIHSGSAEYTANWLSKRLDDKRGWKATDRFKPKQKEKPDCDESLDLTECAEALARYSVSDS